MASRFPDSFAWGAAAASYQIEGAWNADGKGPSVWDMFSHSEGRVLGNHNGDVACDHYHRYAGDVRLMKEIGIKAYRLSLSWPRMIPAGRGKTNRKGLDFYDRLIDSLLAAGIEPWVTLFHWDYPLELYKAGGWTNPDSPDWFAEYAGVAARQLGDRVGKWITLNEPQCFLGSGLLTGGQAPGDRINVPQYLMAVHNALLAHGKAITALRSSSRRKAFIGIAPVAVAGIPASGRKADVEAARKWMFAIGDKVWNISWFTDPLVFGKYPVDKLNVLEGQIPEFPEEDMKTIRQPMDFMGINTYFGKLVRAGGANGFEELRFPVGHPQTLTGWNVTPEALYWSPKFMYERYRLPVVVTENGLSLPDWVSADGKVHDPARIDFMRGYLRSLRRAAREGTDVRGYFHWSVMDNFEWQDGYRHRFGLVHVDYGTQRRTLKDSASFYREVIRSGGDCL